MRAFLHRLLSLTLSLSLALTPATGAAIPAPAAHGVTAELPTGVGYEYLQEVAARPDTTVEPIVLLDYSYYDKTTQLSPAAMALLSIAVGQFVGGLGFIQGIESVFLQGFTKAALSSMITQSVAGVVSGEFDLGQILEGAVFAGLGGGLSASFDLGKLVGASGDSLLGIAPLGEGVAGILSPAAILDGFGDALVGGALSVAQNGGSFGDAVLASFVSSLTAQAMAALQHGIGDLTLQGLAEGSFGHVLLHGTVGCAFAEASGGDCAAGFASGVASSLYAGTLEGTNLSDVQQQNRAQLLGAFVGFVLSSGEAANVGLAGSVAMSAIANNRQLHRDEAVWIRENAARLAEELGISVEEAQILLTAELLCRVSDDFDGRIDENPAVSAFVDANAPKGLVVDNQHLFAELDRNSDEYRNSTINMAHFLDSETAPSTLDLYNVILPGQGGFATQTAISGISIDLAGYSGTYTRPEEAAFLMAGMLLTAYYANLGSDTSPEGLALRELDPMMHALVANAAQAIDQALVRGYVYGDFQGSIFGETDPTAPDFDIFDYYANANLSGLGVAAGLAGIGFSRGLGRLGVGDVPQGVAGLISGAKQLPRTGGPSKLFEKSGGFDQANKDFDSLGLSNVHPIQMPGGGTGRVGELPDGTKVVVRSFSSNKVAGHTSRPTLEIQSPSGSIKIRY